MDIFAGRGGNQQIPLTDKSIAPLHCLIQHDRDNVYTVTPTSVQPTLLDGERIFEPVYVEDSAELILADGVAYPLSELVKPLDVKQFTDWGMVSRHIPDASAAKVFNKATIYEYPVNGDEVDKFLRDNVAACHANYLIDEGRLRAAQELLYEAGDSLYAMQDGSPRLKGAYASLLVVLGKLYLKAGRDDVAAQALSGARKVFASGTGCSEEVTALLNSLS